jgi:cell division protein FtsB
MKIQTPKFTITGSTLLNAAGAVIIVYLLVVLGETVKRNYDMNRQITDLQAQITLLQDQKDALSYNVQYYNTDSFRDREARAKLGLQLPGENVVIIPHSTPAPAPTTAGPAKVSGPKSNLQQWLDFLGGRS